jgi:FAD/FMN-containing dehydrogenase
LLYNELMDLKSQLQGIVKGDVIDDPKNLETFSKDASIFEVKPQIIVAPKDTEDIKSLVKFVNSNPGLSLTPRSAGTDMSGGPLSDSIVLDMTKYFNQIIEVGADFAITQPGAYYRDFEKETLKKKLLLPSYTASKDLCTVGGMVANNSAGEKTLTYGQTERWVSELKVVLADGNEYLVKPLNKAELKRKTEQNDFEGRLYKEIFDLITSNLSLITQAKPKTSKNSSGYYLWNVYNPETEIFDLTKLIVGSQGTLGIITEIKFKLIKVEPFSSNLIVKLNSLDNLDKVVEAILKQSPESFECFDDLTIKYALKYLEDAGELFPESDIKLVLLVSFTGDDPKISSFKYSKTQSALEEIGIKSKMLSPELGERYWKVRRESFALLKNHSENMRTAPFIDDFVINPKDLPSFLPKLQSILEPYQKDMIYTIAGHIGDGNFHIIPLMDFKNPNTEQIIKSVTEKVFNLVLEFKGSMTAEHNDGLVRGPYLEKMFGERVVGLFKEVKKIFDSKDIFNPHKKVDASMDYSFSHLTHEQVIHHGS